MSLKEINRRYYRNMMRIRSIEAEITRVPPFSEEFENLVTESLRLQEEQKLLGADRTKEMQELYERVN